MSLKDQLQEDWKAAIKSRDKFRAGVVNLARAAALFREKQMAQSQV